MNDTDLRADLLEACDDLLSSEPDNVSDHDFNPDELDGLIQALDAHNTPTARHLRRALKEWQDAIRSLQRATKAYDRAEARVRQGCTDLAAELRPEGGASESSG